MYITHVHATCVQGPGMIVSHEQKDIIRSHHDLEKDTCRYHKKACKVCLCVLDSVLMALQILKKEKKEQNSTKKRNS